jgi:multisubunit Na+/H+ antiporter MnhF subunit
MWTRSDILALLQLLAMIFFATVHAAWCLTIHRCAYSPFWQDHVLIFPKLLFDIARM